MSCRNAPVGALCTLLHTERVMTMRRSSVGSDSSRASSLVMAVTIVWSSRDPAPRSGAGVPVAAVPIHPTTGQELQLLALRGVVVGCLRDNQLLPAVRGKTTKNVRRPRRLDAIATCRRR